ncbi:MAG: glycine C-acetyltransferase [Waddliaceae bacterium]|nr:glycine C-acetyltransferase [Waddliaceae bacterium]
MSEKILADLEKQIVDLKESGLYKSERILSSAQKSSIDLENGSKVLNFCSNNYLGLSDHPLLIEAAKKALDRYGFGLSSVRFICGTQDQHCELEKRLSAFLGTEDSILYSSCFDANGGLFETLLGAEDAIISDALNHASIIDGIRLCKAKRYRYANNKMDELEKALQETQDARYRLIVTDGVFSMDGIYANLEKICDLAEKYDALLVVDDSHAVGFVGENGRGTPEYCGVSERVHILTGTFGKALGGASGGYTSGPAVLIDWLRQRSRPYLFSNSLAPFVVGATLKALELLASGKDLREKVQNNSQYFRKKMEALGFDLVPGDHAIIPVMLGDAKLAQEFADLMLEEGVYVIGFSYPVVPKGQARIRTQMSAAHSREDLDHAIHAFETVGRKLGILHSV